eukprot:2238202-Amphidinium_carterae.1
MNANHDLWTSKALEIGQCKGHYVTFVAGSAVRVSVTTAVAQSPVNADILRGQSPKSLDLGICSVHLRTPNTPTKWETKIPSLPKTVSSLSP